MFLLQRLPHCQPPQYGSWLRDNRLERFDAQDRIVRGNEPLATSNSAPVDDELTVERVTHETADEWAGFLQRVYALDTGSWLQALIGRPGWHQYVARRAGEIVAARGMHIGRDQVAWLGMDGPVPGLTTDDYEPDAAISRQSRGLVTCPGLCVETSAVPTISGRTNGGVCLSVSCSSRVTSKPALRMPSRVGRLQWQP